MIVILKDNPDERQLESFKSWVFEKGISIHESQGTTERILGLVGDTTQIDIDLISALDIVADVRRIQEPYKNANRKFHPNNTVIDVNGVKIGGGGLTLIAGPCSVESREQVCEIAEAVKKTGAKLLRGGAFKPRTSPYSFQGLRAEGIEFLLEAKKATGLPIVTEIMDISQLDLFSDVDVIQIGARNMQNFELLRQIGKTQKPILLKRGLSATYEELLMSAEYIMAEGNNNVILCERGIRTFETYTRNTMDVASVPALKKLSHLPVIVDPSHSGGRYDLVEPLSLAATAAGCDGLIIEVHNDPEHALCDGPQSLKPEAFDTLAKKVSAVHAVINA